MAEKDPFGPALYVLQEKVPQMVQRNLFKASCHCKACGGKDTVIITRLKPGSRGEVVRWYCKTDGCHNQGMT